MTYQEWVNRELYARFKKAYEAEKNSEHDALVAVGCISDQWSCAALTINSDFVKSAFNNYGRRARLASLHCKALQGWRENNDNHQ
jgi:hypothetical protein